MTDLVQVRETLVKRTRCATCRQGRYLPTKDGKTWIHLYEDGTFIGPCFDWVTASAFVSLSQAADEIVKCQKEISALRKLNTAYRIGHRELADVALTELEALEETP